MIKDGFGDEAEGGDEIAGWSDELIKSNSDSNCNVRLTRLPIASSGCCFLLVVDMKPWNVTSSKFMTYSKLLLETVFPLVDGVLETHVDAVPFDVLDNVLVDRLRSFSELEGVVMIQYIYGFCIVVNCVKRSLVAVKCSFLLVNEDICNVNVKKRRYKRKKNTNEESK